LKKLTKPFKTTERKIPVHEISFVGLAWVGKDIVFRFIIEYNSLREFGP
jgi:hypothetical protein